MDDCGDAKYRVTDESYSGNPPSKSRRGQKAGKQNLASDPPLLSATMKVCESVQERLSLSEADCGPQILSTASTKPTRELSISVKSTVSPNP
jgi:hypothetical protein